MSHKATAAEYKKVHGKQALEASLDLQDYTTLRHNVKGGYYTKNWLGTIVWHQNGQQRVVVMNDASGQDWKAIKGEK